MRWLNISHDVFRFLTLCWLFLFFIYLIGEIIDDHFEGDLVGVVFNGFLMVSAILLMIWVKI